MLEVAKITFNARVTLVYSIRSMQVEEVGSKWVGWAIEWWKPWAAFNESILEPSYVISSQHQDLDCSLKSPSITKKDYFNCFTWFNSLSKLVKNSLKLMSTIFYQIFIFHQMIALQKLWKMFFISSKKLFSFLRYLNFYIFVFPSFLPCQPLL